MKTSFKLLFTLALIISSLFILTIASSAATLTVGGASSDYATFAEAEAAAQNGDTIVVEADITSDINLTKNKSLEIVLKADLLGGLRVSYATANEVNLTIRTEGKGDRTIYFKKNNDSSQGAFGGGYGNNLSTKYTINFFGTEDSSLVLDGASLGYGLNSALSSLTVNTRHVEIKNFKTGNSQPLLKCSTLNVYDGTKIYDNTSSGSLIVANTINLYSGEIYNNTINGKIVFNLKNLYMYGGSIHNNSLTSTSATAFIVYEYANENVYRFFDGSIYNNYMQVDNSPAFISASKWNAKSMINLSCVGENYYYSSTDDTVEPTVVKNFNNLSYGDISYSVIFKAKDGTLLSAYAMHKGPYATSYSLVDKGGNAVSAITVPEGYIWANAYANCQEASVDTTKQGTYYVIGDHKYDDDFDCTTALSCVKCGNVTIEAQEHAFDVVISYSKGYAQNGEKLTACTHDGCVAANTTEPTEPLLVSLGYSKDTTSNAIVLDIAANNKAIEEYEGFLGTSILYGVAVAMADNDDNTENDKLFDENCVAYKNVIAIKFPENNYSKIQTKITGIGEGNYDTALHCSGYIIINNEITYINGTESNNYAIKVTYNSIPNEE